MSAIGSTFPDWPESVERLVICIGVQKAATSFLFNALASDPRVCVPPEKEVHFWDVADGVERGRHLKRAARNLGRSAVDALSGRPSPGRGRFGEVVDNLNLLRLRMAGRGGTQRYVNYLLTHYNREPVVFEASPNYSNCSAAAISAMAAAHPDTRLILLMRDPVERLWSGVKMLFRGSLQSGTADRDDLIAFFRSRYSDPSSRGYQHSDYAAALQRIDEAGCAEKLVCVFQEALSSAQTGDALSHAFGFLPVLDLNEKVNDNPYRVERHADAFEEAEEAFAHVYEDMRRRFGDRVPDTWRR